MTPIIIRTSTKTIVACCEVNTDGEVNLKMLTVNGEPATLEDLDAIEEGMVADMAREQAEQDEYEDRARDNATAERFAPYRETVIGRNDPAILPVVFAASALSHYRATGELPSAACATEE